ncbi:LuxR C-terminal-related transcriptional regulator [Cloacibacillus evryensis]|uniref:LuxR C-terminal-related transcriptional regulator n=1 Tax=Cloacibacillus evryensis TaxID=508460 RepID=UPI0026E03F80|nr:LuxR C-terminal-related transcriptional regulator [Cloacibacillus evryensis]
MQNGDKKDIYLPPKLQKRLRELTQPPLTVVEAGSGFGKTTAVMEHLTTGPRRKRRLFVRTLCGGSAERPWEELCSLLANICPKNADYLRKFGEPAQDSLPRIASIMPEFRCEEKTTLVLDNFHLARFRAPARLINTLASHGNRSLSIVIITQPYDGLKDDAPFAARVNHIRGDSFVLTSEEVREFFRREEIKLTEAELKTLMRTTEGWIAALSLQKRAYMENGRFESCRGISRLMESTIWQSAPDKIREELMYLSAAENFTLPQAAVMAGEEPLPEECIKRLNETPCIRRDAKSGIYTLHSLLRAYLEEKVLRQTEAFRAERILRAAKGCAVRGDKVRAAAFFAEIKDYDSLLALPCSKNEISEIVRISESRIFASLIAEARPETLARHPEQLLLITLELFLTGYFELFGQYIGYISGLAEDSALYGEARARRLRGELEFLKFFPSFNDIAAMCAQHEKAYELLRSPSDIFPADVTWTFGISSVVCMFWRDSGKLREELALVTNGMPCYHKLQKSHGAGAAAAMAAEMELLAGDDGRAEELAQEALREADENRQDSLCFCAEQILARIALLRGEREKFENLLRGIRRRGFESGDPYSLITAEMCLAFFSSAIDAPHLLPAWACREETARQKCYAAAMPYIRIPAAKMLLENDRAAFRARLGEYLAEAERFHMLLPRIYLLIYGALEREKSGEGGRAIALLKEAFETAAPDRVLLPFAEGGAKIAMLLKKMPLAPEYESARAETTELSRRFAAGLSAIRGEDRGYRPRLSPREKEAARQLKLGYGDKETAERLSVTLATLRGVKKNIYAKLGVHSLTELRESEIL